MLSGLPLFMSTSETATHRLFVFVDASVLPEHKLVNIALDDAYAIGLLSSSIHVVWSLACGSRLEDRPVYVKTTCFETFPFPALEEGSLKQRIRDLGERLDAHRKRQQALHPGLTLTGIYNVLEKLRADPALEDLPVVMLTAEGQKTTAERAAALGTRGYLMKPFSADTLIQHVSTIVPLQEKPAAAA